MKDTRGIGWIGIVPVRLLLTAILLLIGVSIMFTLYNTMFGVTDDLGTFAERLEFIVEKNSFYDPLGELPEMYTRNMFLTSYLGSHHLIFFGSEQIEDVVLLDPDGYAHMSPPDFTSLERPSSCTPFVERLPLTQQHNYSCVCRVRANIVAEIDVSARSTTCRRFTQKELTVARVINRTLGPGPNVWLQEKELSLFPGDDTQYAPPIISYNEPPAQSMDRGFAQLLYIEYIPFTDPPTLIVTPLTEELSEQISDRAVALSQQP